MPRPVYRTHTSRAVPTTPPPWPASGGNSHEHFALDVSVEVCSGPRSPACRGSLRPSCVCSAKSRSAEWLRKSLPTCRSSLFGKQSDNEFLGSPLLPCCCRHTPGADDFVSRCPSPWYFSPDPCGLEADQLFDLASSDASAANAASMALLKGGASSFVVCLLRAGPELIAGWIPSSWTQNLRMPSVPGSVAHPHRWLLGGCFVFSPRCRTRQHRTSPKKHHPCAGPPSTSFDFRDECTGCKSKKISSPSCLPLVHTSAKKSKHFWPRQSCVASSLGRFDGR